jgi:hypothetical protein
MHQSMLYRVTWFVFIVEKGVTITKNTYRNPQNPNSTLTTIPSTYVMSASYIPTLTPSSGFCPEIICNDHQHSTTKQNRLVRMKYVSVMCIKGSLHLASCFHWNPCQKCFPAPNEIMRRATEREASFSKRKPKNCIYLVVRATLCYQTLKFATSSTTLDERE